MKKSFKQKVSFVLAGAMTLSSVMVNTSVANAAGSVTTGIGTKTTTDDGYSVEWDFSKIYDAATKNETGAVTALPTGAIGEWLAGGVADEFGFELGEGFLWGNDDHTTPVAVGKVVGTDSKDAGYADTQVTENFPDVAEKKAWIAGGANPKYSKGDGTYGSATDGSLPTQGGYFKFTAPENITSGELEWVMKIGVNASDGTSKKGWLLGSDGNAIMELTGTGVDKSYYFSFNEVEAGETYYIFAQGSKTRLSGLRFTAVASNDTPDPVVTPAAAKAEYHYGKNAKQVSEEKPADFDGVYFTLEANKDEIVVGDEFEMVYKISNNKNGIMGLSILPQFDSSIAELKDIKVNTDIDTGSKPAGLLKDIKSGSSTELMPENDITAESADWVTFVFEAKSVGTFDLYVANPNGFTASNYKKLAYASIGAVSEIKDKTVTESSSESTTEDTTNDTPDPVVTPVAAKAEYHYGKNAKEVSEEKPADFDGVYFTLEANKDEIVVGDEFEMVYKISNNKNGIMGLSILPQFDSSIAELKDIKVNTDIDTDSNPADLLKDIKSGSSTELMTENVITAESADWVTFVFEAKAVGTFDLYIANPSGFTASGYQKHAYASIGAVSEIKDKTVTESSSESTTEATTNDTSDPDPTPDPVVTPAAATVEYYTNRKFAGSEEPANFDGIVFELVPENEVEKIAAGETFKVDFRFSNNKTGLTAMTLIPVYDKSLATLESIEVNKDVDESGYGEEILRDFNEAGNTITDNVDKPITATEGTWMTLTFKKVANGDFDFFFNTEGSIADGATFDFVDYVVKCCVVKLEDEDEEVTAEFEISPVGYDIKLTAKDGIPNATGNLTKNVYAEENGTYKVNLIDDADIAGLIDAIVAVKAENVTITKEGTDGVKVTYTAGGKTVDTVFTFAAAETKVAYKAASTDGISVEKTGKDAALNVTSTVSGAKVSGTTVTLTDGVDAEAYAKNLVDQLNKQDYVTAEYKMSNSENASEALITITFEKKANAVANKTNAVGPVVDTVTITSAKITEKTTTFRVSGKDLNGNDKSAEVSITSKDGVVTAKTVNGVEVTLPEDNGMVLIPVNFKANAATNGVSVVTDDNNVCKAKVDGVTLRFVMFGDVNLDSNINAIDFAQVKAHARKIKLLSGISETLGDVNADEQINAIDFAQVKAKARKIKNDSFTAETKYNLK